ncbi:hypothetical protein D3C81_1633910 [compost metagenome]
MGVRVVGIPVVDRHPVEPGTQVGFHARHQLPGVGAQISKFLGILGGDDEAELVPIITSPCLEILQVRIVSGGTIGPAGFTGTPDTLAFDVAQMSEGRARCRLAQVDQPCLDGHPAQVGDL